MRIKASKHGDLIIIRFDTVKNLRYSTFRFLYYQGEDLRSFLKCLKNEDAKAFFGGGSFFQRCVPDDITKEEKKIYDAIKKLTRGKFSNYSVILYPECEKIIALDHELCHYFCDKYVTFKKKAYKILKKAYKLKSIKKKFKKIGYDFWDIDEEIIAYCSSEPYCYKIAYRNKNEPMMKEFIELFQEYKNRYFFDNLNK